MKTLIKKEIRLLLPAWITAMLLAIVPRVFIILYTFPGNPPFYQDSLSFIAGLIFAVGLLFLGINSFGQELSCNTLSALLSQPMNRPRIWLIKVGTLAVAFISVWLAAILFASLQFGVYQSFSQQNSILRPLLGDAVEFLTVSALVTFSGGLWSTLLLRQITTAFWSTILAPLAVIMGINALFLDWVTAGKSIDTFVVAALVLYSVAGFFLAWRLFMRAQDVQWTGGEVSLPRRERISKIKTGSFSPLPRHWFSALAWKELQLHQGSFLIAAIILALHLMACFVRKFHPHIQNPTMDFVLENFWILWLLMPLLVGAAAIAEERRMGTLEAQLCLPVSRSTQLFFKFSVTLLLSVLFGAVVPALIEVSICGTTLGNSGVWVIARNDMTPDQFHWVVIVAAAILFVSFYASSLARTALQAIGISIAVALVIYLYEVATAFFFFVTTRRGPEFFSNPQLGIELLKHYLDVPILVLALGWLIFSNFRHMPQTRRFWSRNIAVILAVFICIPFLARAIYFRPWEIFLPLEPRGPVQITNPTQVKFVAALDAIYALAPNGRLWVEPFTYAIPQINPGRGQFLGGSNWVDVAVNESGALAVQSNGTLWSLGGRSAGPVKKAQIGTENDWSHVAGGFSSYLILKKNGSLWAWPPHPNWNGKPNSNPPRIQKLQRDITSLPVRVSADTNWTALYSTHLFSPYARHKDGTLWLLAGKHMIQETNVDNQWSSLQFDNGLSHVEVQTNGDLSYFDQYFYMMRQHGQLLRFLQGHPRQEQLGEPWKWKTAAFGPINGWQTVMAIRSDGTLWKFTLRQPPKFILEPPVQLGTRSDWVAVSQGFSLASDGSIWTWNQHSKYNWLAPSRRPICVGNIFNEIQTAPQPDTP